MTVWREKRQPHTLRAEPSRHRNPCGRMLLLRSRCPGGETGRRTGLKIRPEFAHQNAPRCSMQRNHGVTDSLLLRAAPERRELQNQQPPKQPPRLAAQLKSN